jgi:hypothetical protein
VLNRPAKRAFERTRPSFSAQQQRVIADLKNTGIAQVKASELLCNTRILEEVQGEIHAWTDATEHLEKAREYRNEGYKKVRGKPYEIKKYPHHHVISYFSPFVRFGVQSEILGVVNAYQGLLAKLMHLDVWHTISLDSEISLIESQNWQRDPEDFRLVKVFLYLSDSGPDSGALQYITHSRRGEKYGNLYPQNTPYGRYPPSAVIDQEVAASDKLLCSLSAGTMIFVDTAGLHRGGRARKGDRLVATWEYVTQGSWFNRTFALKEIPDERALSIEERFALLT